MKVLAKSNWLINPLDRAAEILFGLIMALSFTCSISIVTSDTKIRQLIFAALSCNLSWGLVDAIMFLVGELAQRNRNKMIIESVRNATETEKAHQHISEAFSSDIAPLIKKEVVEQIRMNIIEVTGEGVKLRLTTQDFKRALALFFVVFISTFPIIIPFVLIDESKLALRVSNLVAVVMMFMCGWSVSKYVGLNKWTMSISLVLVGIILVAITIALGG